MIDGSDDSCSIGTICQLGRGYLKYIAMTALFSSLRLSNVVSVCICAGRMLDLGICLLPAFTSISILCLLVNTMRSAGVGVHLFSLNRYTILYLDNALYSLFSLSRPLTLRSIFLFFFIAIIITNTGFYWITITPATIFTHIFAMACIAVSFKSVINHNHSFLYAPYSTDKYSASFVNLSRTITLCLSSPKLGICINASRSCFLLRFTNAM